MVLAQRSAQRRHAYRKIVVLDNTVGPNLFDQLLFSDQAATLLHQEKQKIENLFGNVYGFDAPQQGAVAGIESKRAESVDWEFRLVHE